MPFAQPDFGIVQSEADISRLIGQDAWRMDVLHAAAELNLPYWWIGAGFLRSFIWDAIEGNNTRQNSDVDLVYYNPGNYEPGENHWKTDWELSERMQQDYPFAEWEVRNQARMSYVNGFEPYTSTEDGIAQ